MGRPPTPATELHFQPIPRQTSIPHHPVLWVETSASQDLTPLVPSPRFISTIFSLKKFSCTATPTKTWPVPLILPESGRGRVICIVTPIQGPLCTQGHYRLPSPHWTHIHIQAVSSSPQTPGTLCPPELAPDQFSSVPALLGPLLLPGGSC